MEDVRLGALREQVTAGVVGGDADGVATTVHDGWTVAAS
jgi:hypothetical protein